MHLMVLTIFCIFNGFGVPTVETAVSTTPIVYNCRYTALHLRQCWFPLSEHFTETIGLVPIFTPEQLDAVCSVYEGVRRCIEGLFEACELTEVHDLEFQGIDATYHFICEETRTEYFHHVECYNNTVLVEQVEGCMEDFTTSADALRRDPYYSGLSVCQLVNDYLDCVEERTLALCNNNAALWLRELDTRNLEPSAQNIDCELRESERQYIPVTTSTTTGSPEVGPITGSGQFTELSTPRSTMRTQTTKATTEAHPNPDYNRFNQHTKADRGILIGLGSILCLMLLGILAVLLVKFKVCCRWGKRRGGEENQRTPASAPPPYSVPLDQGLPDNQAHGPLNEKPELKSMPISAPPAYSTLEMGAVGHRFTEWEEKAALSFNRLPPIGHQMKQPMSQPLPAIGSDQQLNPIGNELGKASNQRLPPIGDELEKANNETLPPIADELEKASNEQLNPIADELEKASNEPLNPIADELEKASNEPLSPKGDESGRAYNQALPPIGHQAEYTDPN